MIAVDTTFLIALFEPEAFPHIDRCHDRVRCFIDALSKSHEQVLIPAPVLAELAAGRLSRIEEILQDLKAQRVFVIQQFDEVIAIETGGLIDKMKRAIPVAERPQGFRTMMKYDAMIAAAARVRGARALATDNVRDFAPMLAGWKIEIIALVDLPLPPPEQPGLFPKGSAE